MNAWKWWYRCWIIMKIENIQLFYLSMPEILDEADGSQDALIVKVEGGGLEGWGECEASPLTSIANFICPKSHSAANPIRDSILGKNLNNLDDTSQYLNNLEGPVTGLILNTNGYVEKPIEVMQIENLGKLIKIDKCGKSRNKLKN